MSDDGQNLSRDLEQVARRALNGARRRGVAGVRARVVASRSVKIISRDGRPERVEEASQRRLLLHLFVDGRYTANETNRLEPTALDRFLDRAVSLARAVEADPYRGLPEPSMYEGRSSDDLKLYDPTMGSVTADDRHSGAAALDAAVRQMISRSERKLLISVETRFQDSESSLFQLHTDGFEGSQEETQRWGYVSITLRDRGERRPAGWALVGSRFLAGLAEPREVAQRALESARFQLGARPIETATLPMVLENRAVGKLLSHLLAALDGRRLQQRSSFLEGRRGDRVGSGHLDVMDDPYIAGGFGSQHFDAEGLAAHRIPLFAQGVFENPYLDTYYARKLGERPTTGSSSNVVISPGSSTLDELVAGVDRGVLVRGFLGGSSNPTTGDFSLGVHGTLIESGRLTQAVSEMNIAGNHLELWKHLSGVGNDVYLQSALRSPSLLFDRVQFAGR